MKTEWKHLSELEPKGGEQYLCINKDCTTYILHFAAVAHGEPQWCTEDKWGCMVKHPAPTVAMLFDNEKAVSIYDNLDQYED